MNNLDSNFSIFFLIRFIIFIINPIKNETYALYDYDHVIISTNELRDELIINKLLVDDDTKLMEDINKI